MSSGPGRKRWAGNIPPKNYHRSAGKAHPIRTIEPWFAELSPKGQELALRLKFAWPPRTKGSAVSLRRWPRGLPGTGLGSSLPRPEFLRRIEALKKHVGVNQIWRG